MNVDLTNTRLGIDIDEAAGGGGSGNAGRGNGSGGGGVFVSYVEPISIASSLGIMIGDQLLEVSQSVMLLILHK